MVYEDLILAGINAIGNNFSSYGVSSSTALSEETKKKLEALGIDTSKIKSEAEGLQKLKEAQASQGASQAQGAAQAQGQKPQESSTQQEVEEQTQNLASKMGISVDRKDSMDTTLKNISAKIEELKADASSNPTKMAEVNSYESEYNDIARKYTKQSMLSNSLSGLANYNKIALGLS